jgi:hypothetical protein
MADGVFELTGFRTSLYHRKDGKTHLIELDGGRSGALDRGPSEDLLSVRLPFSLCAPASDYMWSDEIQTLSACM